MHFDEVTALVSALNAKGVDYVLFGGVAVNLHGLVRASEAVDVVVRGGAENIERLKAALASVWDDPEIATIDATELGDEYPTLRYGAPDGGMVVDLIVRLGTRFEFDDLETESVEVDGVPVRVATPATLVRMKRDTTRPVDRMDADALRRRFGLTEE